MTSFDDNMKLHEAIVFATWAHRDQKRKGTDVPYIIHPFETAQILTKAGADTELIIAGLLHDTVEDTEISTDDISSRFGFGVLRLVLAASEDKRKSWEERKSRTIEYLTKEANWEEMMLACADKLANIRSLRLEKARDVKGDFWNRFRRGREKQRWYYEGVIHALAPLAELEMYQELLWLFDEVFEERNI